MDIPNLYEPSYIPQKGVGVFVETGNQSVTYIFPLTWFRPCEKTGSVRVNGEMRRLTISRTEGHEQNRILD